MEKARRSILIEIPGTYDVVLRRENPSSTEAGGLGAYLDLPEFSSLTVGEFIRLHRVLRGQTISGLAKQLEIDNKHLDKIEKGQIKTPHAKTIDKLVSLFGSRFEMGVKELLIKR